MYVRFALETRAHMLLLDTKVLMMCSFFLCSFKSIHLVEKPPLVLVIGLRDSEHQALMSILESWGTPHEMLPTIINNESGQGKDRAGT
jgi:hypothetical protein